MTVGRRSFQGDQVLSTPELAMSDVVLHVPVLVDEVLQWLDPQPGQTIVDGTLGGGGHSALLSARVAPGGRVLSLDRDRRAVEAAIRRFGDDGLATPASVVKPGVVTPLWADYRNLPDVLRDVGVEHVDGVLLDIGLSSDQLADATRGFSFAADGPLDLRFDVTEGRPASELENRSDERDLADLIFRYGEERHSRRIARAVVERRRERPFETAADLAEVVRRAVPPSPDARRIDPATRTFQALRIAVNDELGALETFLRVAPTCIRPGGRAAIISFHSLEDRIVKEAFRDDARWSPLTKKPIVAADRETAANPRARSAKLRVARVT
jgi:16S rRNA (cytosine1402-N4)-methyltransferase